MNRRFAAAFTAFAQVGNTLATRASPAERMLAAAVACAGHAGGRPGVEQELRDIKTEKGKS